MPERTSREPIGVRIRQLREKRGWSLSRLASEAGIARSYLYQIERGESTPTEDKIQRLANALDALPSELLGEQRDKDDIPLSLQEFADRMNLGSAEVRMLASIEYRGRKPNSIREWHVIYSIIKATLDENGDVEE